jgi:hypothetical protein
MIRAEPAVPRVVPQHPPVQRSQMPAAGRADSPMIVMMRIMVWSSS